MVSWKTFSISGEGCGFESSNYRPFVTEFVTYNSPSQRMLTFIM
jgi:hypothetical protein